jgi:hypothetical protein
MLHRNMKSWETCIKRGFALAPDRFIYERR